jgi:hypothetical protein
MSSKTSSKKNSSAAADLLNELSQVAAPAEKPKSGKSPKWEMSLTAEAQENARRWVEAKTVKDIVDKRTENSAEDFKEYAMRVMAEKLFASKSKPSNPLVILKKEGKPDHQFQFTMQDRFTYKFKEVPEGKSAREHFIEIFEEVGLHPTDATALVDNELNFTPIVGFRSLTELLDGKMGSEREWIEATEESKEAGRKLAAFLKWDGNSPAPEPISPEERSLILKRDPGVSVAPGFYDRITNYCRNVDQILAVFKVIKPVSFPTSSKFATTSTPTERTDRLVKATAEIIGAAVVKE